MNKLINYLKQGKGRGLRVLLIFSVIFSLLSWGLNYPRLNTLLQHANYFLGTFIFAWFLYAVVLLLSTFLCWAFRLKLAKGTLWRASAVSIIALCLLGVLLVLTLFVLALFGSIGVQLYPFVITLLIPLLLVMLISFSLAETKEKKKK